MSDLYQLLTVRNVQEDEKNILAVLASLQARKVDNDLRLLNYYQEIPVSYPASVEDVDGDMVELSIHQHQAVVMQDEKKVFLKSRHLLHDVIAGVFRANPDKGIALIHRFAYVQIRAERRQFIRVKVTDSIPVSFTATTSRFAGRLADISLKGACVAPSEVCQPPDEQTEGVLSLVLGGSQVDVPATLLKSMPIDGTIHWIFSLDPGGKAEEALSHFIFQRQISIIRELKDAV